MIIDRIRNSQDAGRSEGRLEAKRRSSRKVVTGALALTVVAATVAMPLAIRKASQDMVTTALPSSERSELAASVSDEVLLEGESHADLPGLALARAGAGESIASQSLKGEELQADVPAGGGDRDLSGSTGHEQSSGETKGAILGLGPSDGEGGKGAAPKITAGGTGGGCDTQCITKAWLTPNAGNPNLALEVKTHTPAKLVVYVSKSAPAHSPTGDPYFPAARPKASSGHSLMTVWTANLKHLEADTRYHIIVKAVDAQGGESYREGAFKTLQPAVDPGMGLADKGGPSGCATRCIKTAKLIAADKTARLDVRTIAPAQMRVKASTQPPKQGANGPVFLSFDAWADSGYEYRESWETTLAPLKENTMYHIGLWATDEKGRTSYQQGKFRTRKSVPPIHLHKNRPVRITFHEIHVTNDADNSAGQPGKGELSFDFFVEGEYRPEMHQERRDIKSGQTVKVTADGTTRPGVSALLQATPHVLDLRIFAEEKDSNAGKGGCVQEAGSEPFPQGSGRDGCWEWNNAQVSIDFEEAFKSGALPACYGYGVSGDACLFVRTTNADPAFSVLVSLEFLKATD